MPRSSPLPVLQFIGFIRCHAGAQLRAIILGGLGSGLLQGLTIAVIGMGLDGLASGGKVSVRVFLLFLVCLGSYYWSFRLCMSAGTQVAYDAVSNMQLRISDKLRHSRYKEFQDLDKSKIYSAMLGNKDIVVEAARFLASFISGAAMLCCTLVYAAVISIPGVILILVILLLCSFFFVSLQRLTLKDGEEANEKSRRFLSSLKDLLDGFTEIKMNRERSDDIYTNNIRVLSQESIEAKRLVEKTQIRGTAFFTTFAFFPVGAVLFILPKFVSIGTEQVIKLIAVTLFSLSPLMGFVFFIPLAAKAYSTIGQLEDFEQYLDSIHDSDEVEHPHPPAFENIEIQEATFSYEPQGGQQPFTIQMDDFFLRRGELVILTGGNGSGKSTFMRVLAGLYPLTSGRLLLNGEDVNSMGLGHYRNLFSTVFTDFHLFEVLYGLERVGTQQVRELLESMRLASKVTLEGRRFSTIDLSSGQRKRLALVCAVLEGRNIFLFDEVAADFDAGFREFFYRVFLRELKARGKTVLAISHDDRYFDVADRVLTMRYGSFAPNGVIPWKKETD